MGIKILLCDDDKIIIEHIIKVIKNIKNIEYIKIARNGIDAIKAIKEDEYDIVLMDIDMPYKNGIDCAKEIFKLKPNLCIVFITAFKEFALDAFNVYSFDYILKPFNEKRLLETLYKAIENINMKKMARNNLSTSLNVKEKFIFKKERATYVVNLEDIIMFEKNGRMTKIYTNEFEEEFYEAFYDIEQRLSDIFFRTHKSYIININKIKRIIPYLKSSYQIELEDVEEKALLSKKNEIKFLDKLYILKKEII